MTIASGEFVALYGPSGSGKTTLLMLAVGLLVPDSGTVCFGSKDIGGLSERMVRATASRTLVSSSSRFIWLMEQLRLTMRRLS